jgi:PAS domain S-box-containing protein
MAGTHDDQVFAQFLEQSVDPAFVIGPFEDRILAANYAACALLGYSRDELLATPVSHVHPAELHQLRELLECALRDGRASTIKLTCRTKAGEFLPAEIALFAFESGERARFLSLAHDRSEHRRRAPGD